MSTFGADCIVHLFWSTIRHSFRTSNSLKELAHSKALIQEILTTKLLINSYAQLNKKTMNNRKKLNKTKQQQRLHRLIWAGVLDITRLLFLTAFSYTGYPRLPQNSQTPIRPFTLQDSRFTASNRILNDKQSHHSHPTVGRIVSAQEPRLSPRALTGATVQRGGRSFLRQQCPKPSASSPTHKNTIYWSWRYKL